MQLWFDGLLEYVILMGNLNNCNVELKICNVGRL